MGRPLRPFCVALLFLPLLACAPQGAESPRTSESSGAQVSASEPTEATGVDTPAAPDQVRPGSTEATTEVVGGGSGERSVRVVEGSAEPPTPAQAADATLTLRFAVPEGLTVQECAGAPALRCLAAGTTNSVVLTWASDSAPEPVRSELPEPAQRLLSLGGAGWAAISHRAGTLADPAAASTTLRWTCDGSLVREQQWDRALVEVQPTATGVALLLGGSEPQLVWAPASCGDLVTVPLAARTATALRSDPSGTALAVTGLRSRSLEVLSVGSGAPAQPVQVALPFQPYLLTGRGERWATLPPNAQEGVWVAAIAENEVTMQPLWLPHPLEHVESCGAHWVGWDAATESAWLGGWEPVMEPIVLEGVAEASRIHCTSDGMVGVLAGTQAIFVNAAAGTPPLRVDGVALLWVEGDAWNVVRGDAVYRVTLP